MSQSKIGFILDMDGTLVDSTGIAKRIQAVIMKEFNIVLTPERERELEEYAESMFQEEYSTRLAVKIMWTLMKEVGMSFKERIKALVLAGKLYLKELSSLKLYDGVEELIQFFDDNQIKYVIVTSSTDKSVVRALKNYPNFYEKMKSLIISADSVKHLKPHPESFELARTLMNIPKERIIVVGDTKYDILFGKAMNVITIGVLTGIYTEELLSKLEPDFIIDSVAEIPKIIEKINDRISS